MPYYDSPKRQVVALTASGAVVAAVPGKVLKILAMEAQSRDDDMGLQLTNGNGGAALGIPWLWNTREGVMAGTMYPSQDGPEMYLYVTSASTALYAVVSGTGTIHVAVTYRDCDAM